MGKNLFDDAPDVISGIVENFQSDRLFDENTTLYFYTNIASSTSKIYIVFKDKESDYLCSVILFSKINHF